MLLTVDIGNSNIVIAVFDKEKLTLTLRLKTDTTKTDDEYTILFNSTLKINNIDKSKIDGAIISSVVPNLSSVILLAIQKLTGIMPLVVGPGIKTGLDIKIDNPSQLGSDIVADAVGAINYYGAPIIVIDMGTATTLSAIGKNNAFLGVSIAPGVMVSLQALAEHAAQISQINIVAPAKVIGTNTGDSLRSGIVYGYASMLDGLCDRMEQQIGEPVKVVATGGLSSLIVENCKRNIIHDKDLLVKGLHLLYNRNI